MVRRRGFPGAPRIVRPGPPRCATCRGGDGRGPAPPPAATRVHHGRALDRSPQPGEQLSRSSPVPPPSTHLSPPANRTAGHRALDVRLIHGEMPECSVQFPRTLHGPRGVPTGAKVPLTGAGASAARGEPATASGRAGPSGVKQDHLRHSSGTRGTTIVVRPCGGTPLYRPIRGSRRRRRSSRRRGQTPLGGHGVAAAPGVAAAYLRRASDHPMPRDRVPHPGRGRVT